MIILDNKEVLKANCEIVSQDEQFKRYYKIDSLVLKKGHTPYCLDLNTGEISVVPLNIKVAYHATKKMEVTHKEATFSFDKIYTSALNASNAEKHFAKMLDDIRDSAKFIRENLMLDITKHPLWSKLQELEFTEFHGEKETAVAILTETEVIGKGFETVSICSIYPKVLSDKQVWYFFEMIGGYAKVKPSALTEEMCKGYTLEAFARFNKVLSGASFFTKSYLNTFNERYEKIKEQCQQLSTQKV